MSTFNIKILEENGDIDIYSEANACSISCAGNIVVLYGEDKAAVHSFETIDEITIKKNR